MATLKEPTNLQKIEFNVTTAEGPSRVTIVTGTVAIVVGVNTGTVGSSSGVGPIGGTSGGARVDLEQRDSIKVLLDPTLAPGQFRKATATASLGAITYGVSAPSASQGRWVINDAQATFDDEAGKVQLVIDVSVEAAGDATFANTSSLMFQVTTLAKV
jgi:hypothetical protein